MKKSSILTVCMNPSVQKTLVFSGLVKDTVNRASETSLDASGKGLNVSRVLSQLGKDSCHLTQLGGVFRPLFLELCARDNLRVEWVESGSEVRFCYTVLDRADKSVTELVEEGERVGEGTGERLLEAFSGLLEEFSTVTVSGSMARGFEDTLIARMTSAARAAGCRVILDIRGKDLKNALKSAPTLIKPNIGEFYETFAPELVTRGKVMLRGGALLEKTREICAALYEKYGCGIVLTRGAESVWYAEKGVIEEYPVEYAEPFNTTGSGDAFTAGLAAALDGGASLAEAAALGARCGALNAGLLRPGVIHP